jgi:hypothetical protein
MIRNVERFGDDSMKRYLYPVLLLCAGAMMCRDAATLALGNVAQETFRPGGEQQHLLQARSSELSR